MKITLEPAQLPEIEVVIRGNVSDPEVAQLLQLLGNRSTGRLLVHREEEQFPLDIAQIVYLETADNRVKVHTAGETFESKQKLYSPARHRKSRWRRSARPRACSRCRRYSGPVRRRSTHTARNLCGKAPRTVSGYPRHSTRSPRSHRPFPELGPCA